jgi:hypothetical protein
MEQCENESENFSGVFVAISPPYTIHARIHACASSRS